MPNAYVVLQQGRMVIEKWVGTISHEELISHEADQLNDASIKSGAVCLTDARDAAFLSPPERIHEMFEPQINSEYSAKLSKVALLVSDNSYEKAKVYEKTAEKYNINVIIFSNFDVACRWIGIDPPHAKEQIKDLCSEIERSSASNSK